MHQEQAIVMLEGAAASSLILLYFYRKERTMGIPKVSISLQAGVLSAALCLFLNLLLLSGVSDETSKEIYQSQFVIQILTAGIAIPAAEELVFRGMGFLRLRKYELFPSSTFFFYYVWNISWRNDPRGLCRGHGIFICMAGRKRKGSVSTNAWTYGCELVFLIFYDIRGSMVAYGKDVTAGAWSCFFSCNCVFYDQTNKKGRE